MSQLIFRPRVATWPPSVPPVLSLSLSLSLARAVYKQAAPWTGRGGRNISANILSVVRASGLRLRRLFFFFLLSFMHRRYASPYGRYIPVDEIATDRMSTNARSSMYPTSASFLILDSARDAAAINNPRQNRGMILFN